MSANVDINTLDDDNIPDDEDDGQRRRKRPKKVAGKDDLDQSEIYKPHPLIVVLDVFDDDANCDAVPPKLLTLNFEYLVKLNVVCVGVVESGINILSNLFPDDTGTELPHLVFIIIPFKIYFQLIFSFLCFFYLNNISKVF